MLDFNINKMKYIIIQASIIFAFITTIVFGEMLNDTLFNLPISKEQEPFLYYLTIIIISIVFLTMFLYTIK